MKLLKRYRRLRGTPAIREMVAETELTPGHFVVPLFLVEEDQKKEPIVSMPEYYRLPIRVLKPEIEELKRLGINSVLLFAKVPDHLKDKDRKSVV